MLKSVKKKLSRSSSEKSEHILKCVSSNIIGKDLVFHGPFGKRKVLYCDYTASGKSIKFIESYIQNQVLPYYGNTHTTTNVSSLHTSALRHESKEVIRRCLNCTDDDAVIFVSSGTTGAINKLIHGLNLTKSPVVFISPYEHHSNILPWLEIGAEIIYGEEDETGKVDLLALENSLKEYSKLGRPMIGSYSAASNITGILTDTDAVSILLHKYGAYAFFDYATAGPYVEIDMNKYLRHEKIDRLCYKDVVFCSIHKFVGGPETPGLLVAKKQVFSNPVPSGVGGGTVDFVTHKSHQYVSDIEEREEGGTPAIVESIRAGLVFQLKEDVSPELILRYEHKWVDKAYKRWEPIKNLYILGKSSAERLPIFSLCIIHPESGRFLHHNFVSALLNDLFGIQARGGCACAGPYAEDLLSISSTDAAKISEVITGNYNLWDDIDKEDLEKVTGKRFAVLKPGFTRLNLPYFMDESTIDFILEAVAFVAEHGWKLLYLYTMNPESGDFKCRKSKVKLTASLEDAKICYSLKTSLQRQPSKYPKTSLSYKEVLKAALKQATETEMMMKAIHLDSIESDIFLPPFFDTRLRWFLLPSEALAFYNNEKSQPVHKPFFFPRENKIENIARRTRLKSGSIYAKFCNCPLYEKRHLRNQHCKEFFAKKLQETNLRVRSEREANYFVDGSETKANCVLDLNENSWVVKAIAS